MTIEGRQAKGHPHPAEIVGSQSNKVDGPANHKRVHSKKASISVGGRQRFQVAARRSNRPIYSA
jgi:hypothetical protein